MNEAPKRRLTFTEGSGAAMQPAERFSGDSFITARAFQALGGFTFHASAEEDRRPGDCHILILQSAYQRVVDHLSHDTKREHGGLLLGYELHSPGAESSV